MLAPGDRYQAAAVSSDTVPGDGETFLRGACPIVASYGARDRTLRGAGCKLAAALPANDVAHDVVTYPDAGHGFLNDHDPDEVPWQNLIRTTNGRRVWLSQTRGGVHTATSWPDQGDSEQSAPHLNLQNE